ncbi:MucR family transcriptional regulator [Nakamurella endophytica]|uniref:MucR family transcriptional regulator n=1 Tax=Nakamurella endophytica TaxID=1748367 RepID=UPI00227C5DAD|nr:MucR family transcriptional regulator [Nakamurella endophytica]
MQCAACGRWLNTVSGSHLTARHGLTVAQYRQRYGLQLRRVLEAPQRRAQRSASTRQRMEREPRLKALVDRAVGRAKSGELATAYRDAMTAGSRRSAQRAERREQLVSRAQEGSRRSAQRSRDQRDARAADLGFLDVASYLRDRHGRGWSVFKMAAELGSSRQSVTALLAELDLPGPLDRQHPIEQAALGRVGHATLFQFLAAQPADVGPKQLAAALGHSVPWLKVRAERDGLADRLQPAPTALQRITATAHQAGFDDAGQYLAHRYADGATTSELKQETGLHSQQLAALLTAAGVQRRTDPAYVERQTLDGIGYRGSLVDYAATRTSTGWTVQRMSAELGRSDVWLARRLRAHGAGYLIGPPGQRRTR